MPRTALFTIGYEGRALDELIAELRARKIDRVVDIRELPLSRRRGFSKTPLAAALAAEAIDYVHLRIAGNPHRRDKDVVDRDELLARYAAHLRETPVAIAEVTEAVRGHRAALLCYEREPATCHRSLLAPKVATRLGVRITDL